MAALPSASLLSRTRSGRVPNAKPALGNGSGAVTGLNGIANGGSGVGGSGSATLAVSSSLAAVPIPTSNMSIFLTNLRLLDLDLRPDWPGITARTFSAKDAVGQGQKKRIQCAEWALYQLFCLWDPEEAKTKMQPHFPPADQLQSVNLRGALLRALEQAKKNGTLGRDAIIRKTMLDECRGERLEEVLAAFSSAVLKKAVADNYRRRPTEGHPAGGYPAAALALALETRAHKVDPTQLNALILAHKASLSRLLRHKEVARARYKDFAELLDIKERSLARQRESTRLREEEEEEEKMGGGGKGGDRIPEEAQRAIGRLVRNNWSGSEQWMETLLYGDTRTRKRGTLLTIPPDRVWRRVQAGRLAELEGRDNGGLLEQLEERVRYQNDRVKRWAEFRKHVFGKHDDSTDGADSAPRAATARLETKKRGGIDFGFDAHHHLYPATSSPGKGQRYRTNASVAAPTLPSDYASLLQGLADELAQVDNKPQHPAKPPLTTLLRTRREQNAEIPVPAEDSVSEISDIEEQPILVEPAPPAAKSSEGPSSPPRQRISLAKESLAFSVKAYDSDEEPEPPLQQPKPPQRLPRKAARAAVVTVEVQELQPPPRAVRTSGQTLPIRQLRSPPIRPAKTATLPPVSSLSPPQTPSPDDVTPPQPTLDDRHGREEEQQPQHVVVVQPPPEDCRPTSPAQELADQILASMNNVSPSPLKKTRHTLSLEERTRMSMARASRTTKVQKGEGGRDDHIHEDDEPELDALVLRRNDKSAASRKPAETDAETGDVIRQNGGNTYEDLNARTRKSMANFEASRQKAQLERRRSQRRSRAATAARRDAADSGSGGLFAPVEEADDSLLLAEELMSSAQQDAEAVFRSRPKIKMSPIPSPTREWDDNHDDEDNT
ncbi:hypothetical protein SPI_01388 [Niveomyces insectorum RCEF 264]|uniref:HAUS augmin-like complex subunit 6 N-terminal domain-containing protein n=1 Tax=Niveomyces insectorum RCEF 264 TaxID=1081102 RepID=A0A162JC70_9HYPO|nr:hypothetical protein SPI_01388 [Niveomyces insectorum RCEF 264]